MNESTKKKSAIEHIADQTPDLREQLLARLRTAVPDAFTDGKVDLETLKDFLGEAVETSPERYGLTWPGKRDAIDVASSVSRDVGA